MQLDLLEPLIKAFKIRTKLSRICRKVLEPAKLGYVNKTKESIASQTLGTLGFWLFAKIILDIGNSAIPPLFNGPEMLSSSSDNDKLFRINIHRNSNLDD